MRQKLAKQLSSGNMTSSLVKQRTDGRSIRFQRAKLEKAETAYRTISEVSEELSIPQHVLRFWETKFIAVKPVKRGGGRRYYKPDDIQLLKAIQRLLYEQGYTIKGVQRLMTERGQKIIDFAFKDKTAVAGQPLLQQPTPEKKLVQAAHSRPLSDADSLHEVLDELKELKNRLNKLFKL